MKELEYYWEQDGYCRMIIIIHYERQSWRCGYVGVPEGHPLYGIDDYDSVDNEIQSDVHGGLTFAGRTDLISECKYWFFGFDCNHFGDNPKKCDYEYVRGEVDKLLKVIKDYKK